MASKKTTAQPKVARLNGANVPYVLKRSGRRRTVGLLIDDRGLTVSAPVRASHAWIEEVLQEKAGWVVATLDKWQRLRAPVPSWSGPTRLPYLGGELELVLVEGGRSRAVLEGTVLTVSGPLVRDPQHVERQVVRWYRLQAQAHFGPRAAEAAARLGLPNPPLALSNARHRWGSCSARGDIRLNWRLMKAPPHIIDYVIAHEVAHLVEMNHSARFWAVVARLFDDYEAARRMLKEQGRLWQAF